MLIDRSVVEGHDVFAFFLLLALFHHQKDTLMKIESLEELKEAVNAMAWGYVDQDVSIIVDSADAFQRSTPCSFFYALYEALSLCSPGLLPTAITGNPQLWYSRMIDFYR